MRKNTARHWLHAALDLLPVILIPVFMIYSHRHTINDSSLTIQESKVVDFNQQLIVKTNDFNEDGITFTAIEGGFNVAGTATNLVDPYVVQGNSTAIKLELNHKYLLKGLQATGSINTYRLIIQLRILGTNISYKSFSDDGQGVIFNCNYANNECGVYVKVMNGQQVDFNVFPNLIDLTQMYGAGNEPTSVSEYENYFPNAYYPYVLSDSILIDDYTTQVYNDTDIMSQFTYQMYNAVDKYFNMGNVFNMNNVYQWFELNIFAGSAPLYIYIVWNIVLYEFVMDLLFLLYALFMWFIDMTKRLIEKPMDSIK